MCNFYTVQNWNVTVKVLKSKHLWKGASLILHLQAFHRTFKVPPMAPHNAQFHVYPNKDTLAGSAQTSKGWQLAYRASRSEEAN